MKAETKKTQNELVNLKGNKTKKVMC
jgi:hypothetical protein